MLSIFFVKSYKITSLVNEYRIKTNLFAISPNHAIKFFQKNILKQKIFMSYRIFFKNETLTTPFLDIKYKS